MFFIVFTAFYVAVSAAESTSVSGFSSSSPSSSLRNYEYIDTNYLNSKPSYSDASSQYIITASSPYAKSDTRYSADTSSDSDARAAASLTNSYYKTKYGSEAVVNALKPSSFHSSSSSTSSSSASSSDIPSSQPSNHYTGSSAEYTPSTSQSSSSSASSSSPSSSYYEGSSAPLPSGDYATSFPSYGDRYPTESQSHAYPSSETAVTAAAAATAGQSEYVGRPSNGGSFSVYSGYTTGPSLEYTQGRPTSFSHSTLSSSNEYPTSYHHHHPYHYPHQNYPLTEEYPPHTSLQAQPSHGYKTYAMNGPPATTASYNKYQSVFGAIKSLFGPMLADPSASASHLTGYPSTGSSGYYSPMHHHAPGSYASASAPGAVSSAPPSSYYFSSGSGPSSLAYSKSYPPMRFVSSLGGTNSGSGNSKIIVIRDGGSGTYGTGYPTSSGSMLGSPSSYVSKGKGFAPGPGNYVPSGPSSLSFGPPGSGFPHSYPTSSSSFSNGGSPFLGYSNS